MEDIEREQLIEFIRDSHEYLRDIYTYIESDNAVAAAHACGSLECLHKTLLEALDQDEDEDEPEEEQLSEDELVIQKFLDGFKIVRRNACKD